MKVLAVIPAYNEEQSIIKVIDNLYEFAPDVDILVINDGSTDNTATFCINDGRCMLINMPYNTGLAIAVQTGLRYAAENEYDFAFQFDADGQHKAEYIKDLLIESENGFDIVIGSRYKKNKRRLSVRALGSILINGAIRMTSGVNLTDPTSGFRVYNKKMLREFAENINYEPEPDTIAYLARTGVRIFEIHVTMNNRKFGRSYFTIIKSIDYMFRMCFSIIIVQWFRKRKET